MVGADTFGSVTFYAKKGGYYVHNARFWGPTKLFTGTTFPGQPSQITFSNLRIGTHSFNTFIPDNVPANVDYPGVGLREMCAYYNFEIKPQITPTLNVQSTNSTNCITYGSITVTGLPNSASWGVKFPKQAGFTSAGGASSVTSPAALNLTPGRYLVEVTEDVTNAAATKYRFYTTIASATGDCFPWLTTSTTNATNCNTQDGRQTITGIPYQGFTTAYDLQWGRYPWVWGISWGPNVSDQSMPGNYPAVVDDRGNNFITPGTSIKYTLPMSVRPNSGSCNLGASFFLSTVTLPTNACSNFGAGNGSIQLTGARAMSMVYPNGVMFPGETSFTAVPVNGTVQSANNIPPGNLAVRINDNYNDANSPSNLYAIGVQSNATGTPTWCGASSFWADQRDAASNCNANGRMRLNGLPSATTLCYRWPGDVDFNLKATGVTTVSSGYSYRPGIYNIEINTSTSVANANAGQGYTYYLSVTITNTGTACVATAAPTFATTNVTNVGAADGSITVTVPNALRNTAFGVKFPNVGWMAMLGRNTNTITSPKNLHLPAGTHQVRYMYNVFSGETPTDVNVTIGTGPSGTTHPRPSTAYTLSPTNATSCITKDGRITVSGFYMGEAAAVLFPGYTTYLMPNAGQTSITSPYFLEYGPGTYTVSVKNNAYDPASTVYTYNVTIASASGACNVTTPTLAISATNVANCTNDSSARITVSGFNANQNYGVLFPGHSSFIGQAITGGLITSPAATKLAKGKHTVIITRDIYNPYADFFYMSVFVNGPGGVICPQFAAGFGGEPSCDAIPQYAYLQTFGATGVAPDPTANGPLPFGFFTEFNKVNMGCDQPQDDNYSIVNTTNLTGLGCPASENNRIFGNFQQGTDHSTGNFPGPLGANGGYFVLVNGSYDNRKLFEGILNTTYVCPDADYNFTIWVRDFEPYLFGNIYNFQTIRPIISFLVNDVEIDRDTIGANVTYIEGQTTQWERLGFRFRVPSSGIVKITVKNSAPGGVGNDYAFDDVSITKCVPFADLRVPVTCGSGAPITLVPRLIGGQMPVGQMRWTRNSVPISGWENIPGSPFTYSGAYSVNDTFRIQLVENSNPAIAACIKNSNYFLMRGVGSTCVVLSTDQFNLRARAAGNVNVLDWSFVHQKSTKQYTVEVSADNKTFESVKIIGDANLILGNPSYNHQANIAQDLYYRIKATLFNDEEVYSSTVLVKRALSTDAKLVLVNSIIGNGTIKLNSKLVCKDAVLTIADMTGKSILNTKVSLHKGITDLRIPSGNISVGYYVLSVILNDEKFSFKILKP